MYQGKDELEIIQADIKRGLARQSPQWAMLIDLRRCTSCKACTASCAAEQKSPPGILYRPVYEEESGTYPNVRMRYTPRPCNQCDNPPCVAACPNKGEGKATWKGTTGASSSIVMINYEQCIGCGRCVAACPYKARNLDNGKFYTEGTPQMEAYEKGPTWEYGKKLVRVKDKLPVGVARKCHFCVHRLAGGMVPMCVSTCPARANYFGDLEDKESLIFKVMRDSKVKVLKSVLPETVVKVKSGMFKGKSAEAIAKQIDYPGKAPVFADSAVTKPRVYYILA